MPEGDGRSSDQSNNQTRTWPRNPYAPWVRDEPAPPAGGAQEPVEASADVGGAEAEAPPDRPAAGFEFERAWQVGWRVFRRRYGLLLGAAALQLAGAAPVVLAQLALDAASGGQPLVGALVGLAGQVLVIQPMSAGVILLASRLARGERPEIGLMFAAYSRLGPFVLTALMLGLISSALTLPAAAVMSGPFWSVSRTGVGAPLAAFLLILICSAGALWVMTRLQFALTAAIDDRRPPPGPGHALKLSWRITRGPFWPLLGLGVVNGAVVVGSGLLCGVGVVFLGLPLTSALVGTAYALISDDSAGRCGRCGLDAGELGSPGAPCPECGEPAARRAGRQG